MGPVLLSGLLYVAGSFVDCLTTMTLMWLIFLSFLKLSYAIKDLDVEGVVKLGEALLDFLKYLNNSNNQITDWDSHFVSPCFSWSHVTCRNGHVISLTLASHGFSGTLSPSITKLKYLVSLELQNNNLSGSLPDYIANLTYLQYLNLADNDFKGFLYIPATWGQLSNLKHLDLSSNDLTGSIPMQLFSAPIFSDTHLHCGSGFEQPCVSKSEHPASTNKSKLAKVVRCASCGAFAILCLGAIFTVRVVEN